MTAIARTPTRPATGPDAAMPGEGTTEWRTALVELLVLAEHGDETAAGRLRTWASAEPAAGAVWSRIAEDVQSVRAGEAHHRGAA
jgi:hypothetical protein